MSKLRAVVRHEFMTVVRQPSFWAWLIALPLFIGIIMAISMFGDRAATNKVEELQNQLENIAIIDESGFILPEIIAESGHTLAPAGELAALREQVRDGELTGLIHYPSDLKETNRYDIFVHGTDFSIITTLGSYSGSLLNLSIFAPIGSPEIIALAQGSADVTITTYENGVPSPGFNKYVVPGLIALLFFLIIFFAVGYALTSVSEEKENRSMEMLLTHVPPRVAIVGKLLAVICITLAQLIFFAVVVFLGYRIALAFGMQSITLPAGISLSELVFNPMTIFFSLGFLIAGFALFAGMMTILASMLPAKQANAWSGLFYVAAFSPFWFLSTIMTDPNNPAVTFVTYFPLTSPSAALLRNTFGGFTVLEAATVLLVMSIYAVVAIWLAIRIFPRGALEFNNSLSLRSLFSKK